MRKTAGLKQSAAERFAVTDQAHKAFAKKHEPAWLAARGAAQR